MAGLYPLIFPPNGYRGQLRWIGESAAVVGPDAYSLLLASSREGPVVLPKYVTVLLSDGHRVNIGDNLTLPSSERLARMPNVSVRAAETNISISHPDAELEACRIGDKVAFIIIDFTLNMSTLPQEDFNLSLTVDAA